MNRPFILCADDFGLAPGVDEAIAALAAQGRLSAVSCLVVGDAWRADARALAALGPGVEIGLHLAVTGFPALGGASTLAPAGSLRGQGALLAALATGRVRRDDAAREIRRQIAAFRDALGRLPDYVDGHHHAHQFPRVAAALIDAIAGHAPGWRPWLRVCAEPLRAVAARGQGVLDAATASLLGHALCRRARAAGIATNAGLSGFYDVRRSAAYAEIFPRFLRALGPRHVVVCHPGRCADATERRRPWMRCREHEYAFLASAAFADTCARAGVRVATFAEIARAPA